jgi:hypothetical protein
MNFPSERFPQNCAVTSFEQFRGPAETTPSTARTNTQDQAVTSFGAFPKLPLQNCAVTAVNTRKPVSAMRRVLGVRNWKNTFFNSALGASLKLGGVNHPLRGWGRTPQGVFSHSHPQGVLRAWPHCPPTSSSDDGGRYRQASTAVVFRPEQPTRRGDHPWLM